MSFCITGLSAAPFRHLYGLLDHELAAQGVKRYVADSKPGFPDRVEMRDLEPGETALLLSYTHQPAGTPYRASHAIFVREGATAIYEAVDEVPEMLRVRQLSLRAFDRDHMMVDADLIDGRDVVRLIERVFCDGQVAYVQAHFAKRGCYAARIERV
jgi:hypothetical protein